MPVAVEELLIPVWQGALVYKSPSLKEIRAFCVEQVERLREDYKRYSNPTPYKVSISGDLRRCLKELIEQEIPVKTIQ